MTTLSLWKTRFLNTLLRYFYTISSLFFRANQKKIILFASSRGKKLEGNLLYLYDSFKREYPNENYKIVLLPYEKNNDNLLKYLHELFISVSYMAKAKLMIVDDYFYPIYAVKPKNTLNIIQVWHAIGAFKKFGHSIIGKKGGPSLEYVKYVNVHSNYNKAIVSSSNVVPYYAEAFNMDPNNVLPLGSPRLDFFFDDNKKREIIKSFYKSYPLFNKKKVVLYAPTYRGSSSKQKTFTSNIDFKLLKNYIGDEYLVIIKLHPYISEGLNKNQHIPGFTHEINDFTTHELMLVSDLLITDYSSVIFEYSLLNKPMIFMVPDIDEYIKERDFYFNFKDFVPGEIVTSSHQLATTIMKKEFSYEKTTKFKMNFIDHLEYGHSQRIVSYLSRYL